MSCKPGRLIGIAFPYTDLSTKKRRPVLVVTHPDGRGGHVRGGSCQIGALPRRHLQWGSRVARNPGASFGGPDADGGRRTRFLHTGRYGAVRDQTRPLYRYRPRNFREYGWAIRDSGKETNPSELKADVRR